MFLESNFESILDRNLFFEVLIFMGCVKILGLIYTKTSLNGNQLIYSSSLLTRTLLTRNS